MIDVIKHGENENDKFRARSNIDFFPGLWFNGDHKPNSGEDVDEQNIFLILVNYSNYLYIVNTRLNSVLMNPLLR